ncbi:ATP-binding protein [Enterococcus faecium]|uniref:ATP-binding protein n=1 Tax=Enterococcus faecium TaxID=1352 RepID=UPI0022232968|nr:ATP-binding protein [Enterococcus faecium]MCW1819140.1 ATP-binding protein [Enterococcus faecium]
MTDCACGCKVFNSTYVVQLIVKNFRGYSKETKLNVDELTALIGKNDAGKSTLLEAMEIFFNTPFV